MVNLEGILARVHKEREQLSSELVRLDRAIDAPLPGSKIHPNRGEKMDIPFAVNVAGEKLSKLNGHRPITREEIIKETLTHGKWSRASIMPDDFCYNRKNKGSRPNELCIFLTVNPEKSGGPYTYVGRDYTEPVIITWA